MQVVIDGLNINYTDEGSGECILMLHGWGSSALAYRGIISAFSKRFRCVALDFPGCGESDTMKTPWTLDDYTDFVKKFIDTLKLDNPIMIGHSHGGRVVLKMCADGTVSPSKIILLSAAGLIPKKSLKGKIKSREFKLIKRLVSLIPAENAREKLLNKARNKFGSADYLAAPPVLRQTLVNLVNTDIREVLPNIKSSTLLIWGENDTATPLCDAKTIESLISDCGLCVIENSGHWAFVEQPLRVHAIIRSFLGG